MSLEQKKAEFLREFEPHLPKLALLSERESQMLKWLGEPLSTQQIADQPGFRCTIKTVEATLAKVKWKLGIGNRAELNRFAVRLYWLSVCLNLRVEVVTPKPLARFVEAA